MRKLAWLVVPMAILGELGHQVLERWGDVLAHHLFHIAFAGGAALAFIGFVAIDVRRHGWPEFIWRVRTREPKTT
jgi:hypothetical protein